MIDTHCHLYPEYSFVTMTPDEIVLDSLKSKINSIWLASTEKQDIEWNFMFCKKYSKNLKMWVGWHPEQYKSFDLKFLQNFILKNIKSGLLIGIGEIGLDFQVHNISTKKDQVQVFTDQLKVAQKYNLPVAIHSRDAFEETLQVLSNYTDLKILWHCFNLNKEQTIKLLKVVPNVYIALNSIFTYKSGNYINDSLQLIDRSKIVLETDSPFLSPRPFKYTFNTPSGVLDVYNNLAKRLNVSVSELQNLIKLNCDNLQSTI